jgi:3-deoxy-D-manno-octulosonate 8-phosphate phosphatase (KDO 8-P phosphatase)
MNVLELFKPITTFVFDVDGVLTDGMLLVMPGGAMIRRMNIKDGYALQLAIKKGYRVVIISGGDSPEVKERLHKLGVHDVFMRVENKLECLQQYKASHALQESEMLFMGDDIPDYDVMQSVALPCCPADAVTEIRGIARYISPFKGGEGCGRDVIEKAMKLRGDWIVDTQVKSQ